MLKLHRNVIYGNLLTAHSNKKKVKRTKGVSKANVLVLFVFALLAKQHHC